MARREKERERETDRQRERKTERKTERYRDFLFSVTTISALRSTQSYGRFIKSDVWLTVHRNSVWIRKTN